MALRIQLTLTFSLTLVMSVDWKLEYIVSDLVNRMMSSKNISDNIPIGTSEKNTHKCRFNEHRGYMFMILNLKSTNKCTKTKQNTQKGENGKNPTKTQKPSKSASHRNFPIKEVQCLLLF